MAPRRLQVDTGLTPAGLQAPAAPVNTFVQPVNPEQTAVGQLATSLSKISPALGRFADVIGQRKNEADFEAGKARIKELRLSAAEYAKQVKSGKLLANHSPWFVAGMQEAQGQMAGTEFGRAFVVAAATDPTLQESIDPADFEKFAHDFSTQWNEQNGVTAATPRFLTGYTAQANAYIDNYGSGWAAGAGDRAKRQLNNATIGKLNNYLTQELVKGTSSAVIAQAYEDSATVLKGLGADLGQFNAAVVESTIQTARRLATSESPVERMSAMRALDLLDHIRGGPEGTIELGKQDRYSALVTKAREDVASQVNQMESISQRREERARDQTVRAVYSSYVDAVINAQAQGQPIPDGSGFRAQLTAAHATVQEMAEIDRARQMIMAGGHETDPRVYDDLFSRISRSETVGRAEIVSRIGNGLAANDAQQLMAWQNTLENDSLAGGKAILKDPILQQTLRLLPGRFAELIMTTDKADALQHATETIRNNFYVWRTSGAGVNADPTQIMQYLSLQADAWVNFYRQDGVNISTRTVPPANFEQQTTQWNTQSYVTDVATLQKWHQQLVTSAPTPDTRAALMALAHELNIPANRMIEFVEAQLRLAQTTKPTTTP